MTQRERDRLVVLKKAQKKLITQRQAAAELQLNERQIRRLLVRLKEVGDRAVVHGLRERRSNRRLSEETRESAVRIPRRSTGVSDSHWPASTWSRSTNWRLAARR